VTGLLYLAANMPAHGAGRKASAPLDWQPQPAKAALMLVHAHADDEGLFFGAALTYYARCRNLPVVDVCTTHDSVGMRGLELKDAVWMYGLHNPPVCLGLGVCCSGEDLACNWDCWGGGDTAAGKERATRALTEQIRRFKPDVVLSHDFDGEYGHPNHIGSAFATAWACSVAADASVYPEQVALYGTWQVKKLYVHLYAGRPLTHSWDIGCAPLLGKTALGYHYDGLACHASQGGAADPAAFYAGWVQESWGAPERWGLYRTAVGDDAVAGNDFFEHVDLSAYRDAPLVWLSSPVSELVVDAGQTVTIAASVVDSGSNVSSVTFTDSLGVIGTDMTPPYEVTTGPLAGGNHLLRAKVLDANGNVGTSQDVMVMARLAGGDLQGGQQGSLQYSYVTPYTRSALPDFSTLTPTGSGTSAGFDTSTFSSMASLAVRYTGYIRIDAAGVYTFYATADDGSRLYIGKDLVVDHGLSGTFEKSGQIALLAGYHPIQLDFYDRGYGRNMTASYSSDAVARQAIPSSVLYCGGVVGVGPHAASQAGARAKPFDAPSAQAFLYTLAGARLPAACGAAGVVLRVVRDASGMLSGGHLVVRTTGR